FHRNSVTFVTRTISGVNLSHDQQRARAANGLRLNCEDAAISSELGGLNTMTTRAENQLEGGQAAIHTPPVVSPPAWEAARWKMPWFTIMDSFDADFGVDEWHGTNVFYRDGDRVFRTYFINNRGDEQMGSTWNYLDITPLGRQEVWEDSPEGYPQTPPYKWWNWHDNYDAQASPDPKWLAVSDAGEAAFRKRNAQDKAS